jgi:class 3 adenylate cyclase
MGLSILRARALDADLEQVALWGGGLAAHVEGASEPPPDVATWRARGLSTHLLDPGPIAPLKPPTFAARAPSPDDAERLVCAMLFGEITGYNGLREASIPVFVREVMGAFGAVLDSYGADVLFRGMWGERVYIVMSNAPSAAQCALDLQARMASIPLASLGLPPNLSLRLGGHLGPVYRGYDPIAKGPSFFGMDIARTARVEPIMPEGEVFVTEPFAAALMLDSGSFSCDYVGTMQVSKGPSGVRTYVLKRA